jgi:outer membrane protein OmpA-like peptidoglycan-associated protein
MISIFGSSLTTSYPQTPTTEKAIVLINGEVYLVDLSENGDIITTYQKIENYFSSTESHKRIITRLTGGALSETGDKIVFYEKEVEPQPSYSSQNSLPINQAMARYIGFSPNKAILNKKAVDQIREIADAYKNGTIKDITITLLEAASYRERALSRNRADAIKGLLKAFGVADNYIFMDNGPIDQNTKIDFVKVDIN